jgi:hypothetical protein
MKEFTFETRQRNVLLGLMALGAVCLIASFFDDPTANHTRFWTNLLHNSAFFTGIAFTSIFALGATITVYAGWHTAFKRIWEAFGLFLPIGLLGILIVGVAGKLHMHHLYHWMDDQAVATDKILKGKSGFLNFGFYLLAVIGFGGIWYFFMTKFRKLSLEQDEARPAHKEDYPWYDRLKVWGAMFLPIAGFTSAAAIWLWLMSLDAHWYSTMYAWYTTASWWVSTVASTILMLIYLKGRGYFTWVTDEHLHDLGKFLFAFSVFWTYLWFSQYMLIWYANIGEETIYFRARMGEFPVLFYGNLIMNFALPFLILIRNDTKRKWGTMVFAASLVLFGHWWDFFQMVKVGPYKAAMEHHGAAHTEGGGHGTTGATHGAEEHAATAAGHGAEATHGADIAHAAVDATPAMDALQEMNTQNYFHYKSDMTLGFGIPGLLELGIMLGFGALFVFFVFSRLAQASLLPKNDPYLEETLNHHV